MVVATYMLKYVTFETVLHAEMCYNRFAES